MKPIPLLYPLSLVYGAGVGLRNLFFEWNVLKSVRVPIPVISIGNITAGGSGKTTLVEVFAKKLGRLGKKVAIVSRGYGRTSKGLVAVSSEQKVLVDATIGGDEPVLLAERLSNVPVIVDANRVRGARYAIETFDPEIILMDDGFQHRYLFRDLDVVIISARDVLGRSFLLPAGYRREFYSALERANIIVISKCSGPAEVEIAKEKLRRWFGGDVAAATTKPAAWTDVRTRQRKPLDELNGRRVVAVCGIGDPSSFSATLGETNAIVVGQLTFPDHHWYKQNHIAQITSAVRKTSAEYIMTTEKDLKRFEASGELFHQLLRKVQIGSLDIEVSFLNGEALIDAALRKVVSYEKEES